MALVPSTPQRASGSIKVPTPRTTLKQRVPLNKTIHTFDANSSYLEEDDDSWLQEALSSSDSSEDDEVCEDLMLGQKSEGDVHVEETEILDDDSLVMPKATTLVSKFVMRHEVGRKVLHSFIGVFTLKMFTLGITAKQFIFPLSILFILVFLNDYIRLNNPEINKRVVRATWWMIRENEINGYNGVLWYLAGLILVFVFFPKDICMMLVLLLSWADTAASTVGRAWGKYTPKFTPNKLVAGCLGLLVAGVILCLLFYGYFVPAYPEANTDISWLAKTSQMSLASYALAAGFIASGSEMVDFMGIDDNFSIPVISAVALYILVRATELK